MVREMGPRLALKFEHTRFRNDGAGPLRNGSSGKKARDERGGCFINASDARTEIFNYIEAMNQS